MDKSEVLYMKLTISKSKNSVHFYVQKSIRKKGGGTTSIMVEKLGSLEEVRTKAGGKDPYAWAQDYVNELSRKECEEEESIIVRYSQKKLISKGEQRCYNCGYLFLQSIYYSLGLDRICAKISARHKFDYDLNEILSRLIYTRILYPSSKQRSTQLAKMFVEQPSFELQNVYRALSVLAGESDFIQSELYGNSQKVLERRDDILYYDCTNYYFEIEQEEGSRKYGHSKQHQPLPIIGMGLFMDHDGIPMAFDMYDGNKNEQGTLRPLEQKILQSHRLDRVIVCTDAGLSSKGNRKFNDKSRFGEEVRNFITTQSVKQLPDRLKEYALDDDGWRLPGGNKVYKISGLDPDEDYDKVFYKDRWIKDDLSQRKVREGSKPLEQHLIVTFSLKYRNYLRTVRGIQIDRAQTIISSGRAGRKSKGQNDPRRFIGREAMTADGEECSRTVTYLDTAAIAEEEKYDGFYAVCTNLAEMSVSEIIGINKGRWKIEECFRIMKTEFKARPVYLQDDDRIKAHFLTCFIALFVYRILEKKLPDDFTTPQIVETLHDMTMNRPGEKQGYTPNYTRTDLTDALHEAFGFRTDYGITSDAKMRALVRISKGKKK